MARDKFRQDEFQLDVEGVAKPISTSKADAIRNSNMPEAQKEKYLRAIGAIAEKAFDPSEVDFSVYATVRGISVDRKKAMLVYPQASGVKRATLQKWDEIFSKF